MKKLSDNAVGL